MPDFDPAKTIKQIYPILAFRDKVVRTISSIIEKIPGLEALVDRIVETLTVFVLSLLAPFVRPVLNAISKSLQVGSEGVIDSSGKHQYEVWTDARCSDPTHSMLSKDHFSNILNEPAGLVAGEILKFIAPRVLYAWEHTEVPVEKVMQDVDTIFHHPAIRNEQFEVHRNMFNAVKQWKDSRSDRGRDLDNILSMESVRTGKNHKAGVSDHAGHGSPMGQGHGGQPQPNQSGLSGMFHQVENMVGGGQHQGSTSHQNQQGGIGGMFNQAENLYNTFSGHGGSAQHHSSSGGGGGLNDMLSMAGKLPIPGVQNFASTVNKFSSFIPGGRTRGIDDDGGNFDATESRGRGLETGPGGTEMSFDPSYAVFGGSSIGGAGELRDAMNRANRTERSPSPMPLRAPAGYEDCTSGGYEQAGQSQQQYGSQQGGGGYGSGAPRDYDYYQGGNSGGQGESGSYYRS